ncbi:MAG: (d)CMP kinase [Ruminococcaceae bacterium]|nr:(d)CMP kinase [Oscillospiraceae bacterium]
MKHLNIALDGPAGAGKSFLCREIAKHYGLIHVDTGALYRTIGLYVLRLGIDPKDTEKVISSLGSLKLGLEFSEEGQYVTLDGENVNGLIRTTQISEYASDVSKIPEVRAFLLDTQRNIAKEKSVIMDGRDIGTVILPDANVKIFLTARDEVRAQRRYDELIAKGIKTTYEQELNSIVSRDNNDRNRATAPAVPAEDAIILDNSDLDREGTLAAAIKIIDEKIGE